MNKAVLIGRLTKDPELNFMPGTGNAVCNFTLAINRRFKTKDGKQEADFIPIQVWGKIAESVANYTSKGRLVGVSGRIQTRSYDAQDGSKRYVTEVVADEVEFLDYGDKTKQEDSAKGSLARYENNDNLTEIEDDEVPF